MAWTDPVRYPNALEQNDPEGALNTYVIDNVADVDSRVRGVADSISALEASIAGLESSIAGASSYTPFHNIATINSFGSTSGGTSWTMAEWDPDVYSILDGGTFVSRDPSNATRLVLAPGETSNYLITIDGFADQGLLVEDYVDIDVKIYSSTGTYLMKSDWTTQFNQDTSAGNWYAFGAFNWTFPTAPYVPAGIPDGSYITLEHASWNYNYYMKRVVVQIQRTN